MSRGIVKKPKAKRQYNFDPTTLVVEPRRRKPIVLKNAKADNFDDLNEPDIDEDLQHIPREFSDMMKKRDDKISKAELQKQQHHRPEKKAVANKLVIEPGETMAHFNRRVNEALPIIKARTGVPSKADLKKKIKREKALKKQKEQGGNINDENDEEKTPRRAKRERSPDPWAHLESKKEKPKFGDTVDRPPDLRLPSKLLKNVPKSAGSLAKRQMLEQERERVISNYRQLMEKKRKEHGVQKGL